MNIVIKQAEIGDSNQITILTHQLGYSATENQTVERLNYLLDSKNHGIFTAKNKNRNLCGWVVVEKRVSLEAGYKAQISGLIVGSNFRRHGIGKKLVLAAEDWAIQSGLFKIVVSSNIQRQDSHIFYKRIGYFHNKTVHYYEKVL